MTEPRTAAGRALLAYRPDLSPTPDPRVLLDAILAIEAQAAPIDPTLEGAGAAEPVWLADARRRYVAVLIALLDRCARADEAVLMDRIERWLEVVP